MIVEGINVVGVQFRRAGRIYDFAAGDLDLKIGDDVVVDTERGPSLAKVTTLRYVDSRAYAQTELKPILRVASNSDLSDRGRLSPDRVMVFAKEKIAALRLDMRVLKAEMQFSGNKVILYFSAPGRVDFRELVKELAGGLKARVELKQVGARDEAKLVGGLGICGREYCCSSFLREFVPVSIRMAKNQNLALNPSKVSGGCGRLLCCLTYENDLYTELRRKMPPKGARVKLPGDAYGDVIKADFLNQIVVVETDEGQQVPMPVAELELVGQGEGVESDGWGEDLDLLALGDGEILPDLDDDAGGNKAAPKQARPSGAQKPAKERRDDRRPPRPGPKGERSPQRPRPDKKR